MKPILSSNSVPNTFVGAKASSDTATLDFEDGPVAINDISKGLTYQIWRVEVDDNKAFLSAPNYEKSVFLQADELKEVSLAFDGNARPTVIYISKDTTYLKWYDSFSADYIITNFGKNIVSPKAFMDDKRPSFQKDADIILLYLKDGKIHYRLQRDRYGVEYKLNDDNYSKILNFGMLSNYRLGIRLE